MIHYIENASAIEEESGLINHAAIAGLSLGKDCYCSEQINILNKIEDGQVITISPKKGYVYKGKYQ